METIQMSHKSGAIGELLQITFPEIFYLVKGGCVSRDGGSSNGHTVTTGNCALEQLNLGKK
jgi:hypothetical protein